jgi:hypothetical protein
VGGSDVRISTGFAGISISESDSVSDSVELEKLRFAAGLANAARSLRIKEGYIYKTYSAGASRPPPLSQILSLSLLTMIWSN